MKITDEEIVANILRFNKEVTELNVKYSEEIEELKERINKAIKYCEESNLTLKSHYFMDVIKILKGE